MVEAVVTPHYSSAYARKLSPSILESYRRVNLGLLELRVLTTTTPNQNSNERYDDDDDEIRPPPHHSTMSTPCYNKHLIILPSKP
jgi:hypothetical protein